MSWHETLTTALLTVTSAVSHGERLKSDRYIVWQEDGTNDLLAGNSHAESAVTGAADLYSKTELDPWAEAVGAAFDTAGICWSLVSVAYEEETGFWHWSWDWEVV